MAADQLTTLYVVDDHDGYRAAVSAVVAATPGVRLVGAAATAAQALDELTGGQDEPDLVLMDINLQEDDGIELTRSMLAVRPGLRVLYVSTLRPDELPSGIRDSGGVGFLSKSLLSPESLQDALAGVYNWAT